MKIVFTTTALLFLARGNCARAEHTYAGTWETTYGKMILAQDGNRITGFYLFEGQRSTIEGTVEKGTMTGSWNHDNRKGDFKLTKK